MSNLDDAIAENTAFDLLEIRQAKRAKVNRTPTAPKKTPKEKEGVYKFDKEHTSWNSNDRRKGF
ncbi:hypothetical protein ACS8E2_12630 [Psychrobacter glaciei]|uniref:hypothetical protein n=1 Tax=Psychrobacter glaciei TaxID=619771 RepID=UPI003F4734ED